MLCSPSNHQLIHLYIDQDGSIDDMPLGLGKSKIQLNSLHAFIDRCVYA